MTQYINISHNDLDGIACNLILREKFHDMETYHVSYNNIEEYLKIVELEISHLTKVLFITDLAFSSSDFDVLMRIADCNKELKIFYIDHHPYENESLQKFKELKEFKNVYIKHKIGKSATLLCKELTKPTNQDIINFANWVNAFDIYKEFSDPENFKIGWFLNTVFWELKQQTFKSYISREHFKIPKFFKDLYKKVIKEKNEYFKKLIEQKLVQFDEDNKILLSFSDKYKSFWQSDYPEYDYFILPYKTISKNISIRITSRKSEEEADEKKNKIIGFIKNNPWLISVGGHSHAFGITLNPNTPVDDHMVILEEIHNIFIGDK